MGRRKGQISKMGQSLLVKDKNKKLGRRPTGNDSFLHTTELDDGAGYNRINFQSVTEQNNLEDFLTTAEMAGKDFTAERQNIQIISNPGQGIKLTESDLQLISQAQDTHRAMLQIPRRPKWDETTTKEQLALLERESFTDWRRQLKLLEEKEHIQLTPYEKNLDFWRQLWRVIERSDVIVQIVDARNPLLFRCEDLDVYVQEVDPTKKVLLLVNKADFLTEVQRQSWVNYFNKAGINAVFFSAKVEKAMKEGTSSQELQSDDEMDDDEESDSDDDCDDDSEETSLTESHQSSQVEEGTDGEQSPCEKVAEQSHCEKVAGQSPCEKVAGAVKDLTLSPEPPLPACQITHQETSEESSGDARLHIVNKPDIMSAQELLEIFRRLAQSSSEARSSSVKTIGMVGYPNVGKSSTINVILEEKRLGVSATPGKTKHLQTLYVDEHLILCDCPGLVFPSFVATKAHLVINGILPIDELRDHVSPVALLCDRIPRNVLEATYSIMIPRPSLDDISPNRNPTAEELLNSYGAMRGFMTARGTPDGPRASRYILKDYVKGKLLYCEPPPGIAGAEFQDQERITKLEELQSHKLPVKHIQSDVDKEFFEKKKSRIHSKGVGGVKDFVRSDTLKQTSEVSTESLESPMGSQTSISTASSKPWKKHNNRNKKEKLRRLHRDLDVYT
ncbi:large subunit GTPase 1 homolog [Physella acuta]|uniref:large subunit GTPase 1 homolog n=1 Tax=Physella acuta TaxID=109671 RepID=UPI0027DCB117|nr:large subunit GTPase 1 homolog [Physella acuta]